MSRGSTPAAGRAPRPSASSTPPTLLPQSRPPFSRQIYGHVASCRLRYLVTLGSSSALIRYLRPPFQRPCSHMAHSFKGLCMSHSLHGTHYRQLYKHCRHPSLYSCHTVTCTFGSALSVKVSSAKGTTARAERTTKAAAAPAKRVGPPWRREPAAGRIDRHGRRRRKERHHAHAVAPLGVAFVQAAQPVALLPVDRSVAFCEVRAQEKSRRH